MPAVGGLADQHLRDDQLARQPGFEGHHADGNGVHATHVVGVLDGRQHGGHVGQRHACGCTAAGDADAVAHEQVTVAASDVVEIEVAVVHGGKRSSVRAHRQ